jgi:outer membrane protein OmpA-like peptidoglycan-associated protein
MNAHDRCRKAWCAFGALALLAAALPAYAQFTDALKKMADKAAQAAASASSKPGTTAKPEQPPTADEAGGDDGGAKPAAASSGSVASVSTKFDFVPGDKVLFIDDFRADELGEFPNRWSLSIGTFEVAEMGSERWLRCTARDGTIRMKLPAMAKLPEFWTLEFDFYATEPMGSALTVRGVNERGDSAWEATFPQGNDLAFRSGDIFSTTPLEGAATPAGRHHVMLMARGPALKVYMNRQRMANVPDISVPAGLPNQFEIRLAATTGPMITNVRFAEGNRPTKDIFEAGNFVTHGIQFSSGSDAVLPESAPALRQVAAYLETHSDTGLRIVGHTDNVGSAPDNLDLSQRRATSVAKVLTQQFGIASSRFETAGKGDSQPLSSNATPEGRAMNRRVEFVKR